MLIKSNFTQLSSVSKPLAFSLLCLFAACGDLTDESRYNRLHSSSGYRGLSYTKIIAELDQLGAKHSQTMKLTRYGRSEEGRDLAIIRLGLPATPEDSQADSKRPAVLITQGIHGDEYQALADRLVAEYVSNPEKHPAYQAFLKAGGILYVVPVLNPDGYERHQRGNTFAIDLNRDWPSNYLDVGGFKASETKSLAAYLREDIQQSNAALKMTFDYHCCSQAAEGGLMLHPWGTSMDLQDGTIPAVDIPRFELLGRYFKSIFKVSKFGTPYQMVHYTGKGSLMDYLYEVHDATAVSFEGIYKQEHSKFDQHALFWDGILASVNQF